MGGRCNNINVSRPLQLTSINLNSQEGQCGVRIVQQFDRMQVSKVSVYCDGELFVDKACHVTSVKNVKKLLLRFDPSSPSNSSSILLGAVALFVDGTEISFTRKNYLQICWEKGTIPVQCDEESDSSVKPFPPEAPVIGPVR